MTIYKETFPYSGATPIRLDDATQPGQTIHDFTDLDVGSSVTTNIVFDDVYGLEKGIAYSANGGSNTRHAMIYDGAFPPIALPREAALTVSMTGNAPGAELHHQVFVSGSGGGGGTETSSNRMKHSWSTGQIIVAEGATIKATISQAMDTSLGTNYFYRLKLTGTGPYSMTAYLNEVEIASVSVSALLGDFPGFTMIGDAYTLATTPSIGTEFASTQSEADVLTIGPVITLDDAHPEAVVTDVVGFSPVINTVLNGVA